MWVHVQVGGIVIRCMFFLCVYWGFDLRAEHIPGDKNVAVDAVSRNNLFLFFQVLPGAATHRPQFH